MTASIANILFTYGSFPDTLRGSFWILISGADVFSYLPYSSVNENNDNNDAETAQVWKEDQFKKLLQNPVDKNVMRTIDVDLSRTFPRHQFFMEHEVYYGMHHVNSGMGQLRQVLTALAVHDSETGYVTFETSLYKLGHYQNRQFESPFSRTGQISKNRCI